MKSFVAMTEDGRPFLCLLRGDHQLSETKFQTAAQCGEFRPAHPEEIRELFGADPGSLGPVGVKSMPILIDEALRGRKNMVTGANKDDYHLRNVTLGEDFEATFHDLRQVAEGDTDIETGGELEIAKTVEIGHIFKLGYKYSKAMGLNVLNQDGVETPVIMGSYGIGVERVLCAAVELYSDANGISMPVTIAPFEVVITPVKISDAGTKAAADAMYAEFKAKGIDVLYDDRDMSPGAKFKDADLIGVPYRVTLGRKLSEGIVEVVERRGNVKVEVAVGEVVAWVAERVAAAKAK